jgi:thioredoxin reductase (NADPH)
MYDLIIIGAGPAGLVAGIYAGRFRLNTLILEKMSPGGQIILSPEIENFPGFPTRISTEELVGRFKKQVDDLGIKIETGEVQEIIPDAKLYRIKTQENTYEAKTVIISSGAQAKRLGVKGEEELISRGVSYCGTCDGPLFKNKEIAVIGGGDRAIEEAIFLSSYASRVFLIHRRSALRASRILEEKAKNNPKINFVLDSIVEEISGGSKVEAVKIKNVKTNSLKLLSCSGVFIYVGIKPNTDFLKNLLEIDEEGFIITDEKMQASRTGIFACGDCRKKSLYQVITACADGATAADAAHKYLLNQ